MATLTGNTIASTYTGLLSVTGAVGADTVEAVTDGAGTSTSLSLSQQRATITLGSGAADDFIVDGTTLVVEGDNNRVGIGTITPQADLHIEDTSSGASLVDIGLNNSTIAGSHTLGTLRFTGTEDSYSNYDVGAQISGVTSEAWSSSTSGGGLYFDTCVGGGSNTVSTRMVILASGNVGIGTTSPTKLLEISYVGSTETTPTGILSLEMTDTGDNDIGTGAGPAIDFRIPLSPSATKVAARIGCVKDIGTDIDDSGELVFYTSTNDGAAAEYMRIDKAGNVGIGTTSPDSLLDIMEDDGSNGATLTLTRADDSISSSAVLGTIDFVSCDADGSGDRDVCASIIGVTTQTHNAADFGTELSFWTSDDTSSTKTQRLTIAQNGNVGIGNTAPGNGLVFGDSSTSSPIFQIIANDATTSEILFTEEATNRFGIRMDASSDDIQIYDYVATAVAASISTGDGAWQDGSDLRIKKDIENIDSCLSKINALRPITWKRKYGALDKAYAGLVAQEVLPHFPLVVGSADRPFVEIPAKDAVKDENGKIIEEATPLTYSGGMTIGYSSFVPYLIKAVQELSAKVTALENA